MQYIYVYLLIYVIRLVNFNYRNIPFILLFINRSPQLINLDAINHCLTLKPLDISYTHVIINVSNVLVRSNHVKLYMISSFWSVCLTMRPLVSLHVLQVFITILASTDTRGGCLVTLPNTQYLIPPSIAVGVRLEYGCSINACVCEI